MPFQLVRLFARGPRSAVATAIFPGFFAVLCGCSVLNCSSARFLSIEEAPSANRAALYVLRPESPAYALWEFTAELHHYPGGDFTDQTDARMIASVELANHEFARFVVAPGVYRLELPDFASTFKVLRIEAGATEYVRARLFSTGFFAPADVVLEEIDRKQALQHLLGYGRMKERPAVDASSTSEN